MKMEKLAIINLILISTFFCLSYLIHWPLSFLHHRSLQLSNRNFGINKFFSRDIHTSFGVSLNYYRLLSIRISHENTLTAFHRSDSLQSNPFKVFDALNSFYIAGKPCSTSPIIKCTYNKKYA